MGITAGSSFTSVDDTSLVALAESGLGFNRPDGKKQANNFDVGSIPVSYTHLDVYKRQTQANMAATAIADITSATRAPLCIS